MTYWHSWQGDRPNWDMMRACRADELDTEGGVIDADLIVDLSDATIEFTHETGSGLHAATVRATKPD